MKIGIYPLSPEGLSAEQWLASLDAAAKRAVEKGAVALILPEFSFPFGSHSTDGLHPVQCVARERRLNLLVGFREKLADRLYSSVVLVSDRGRCKSVVRCRLVGSGEFSDGNGPQTIEVARTRMVLAVGSDWQSTELLRGALADPTLGVLLVAVRHDHPSVLTWARQFAASDGVFVVVCNAGIAGSIAVAPDGRVLSELDPLGDLQVADLSMPQNDPLSGLPEVVRWDDLKDATKAELRMVLVWLLGASDEVGRRLHMRPADVVRRQIRRLWANTNYAQLWSRLSIGDKTKITSTLVGELKQIATMVDTTGHVLALAAQLRWVDRGPVTDVSDASRAVLRKALRVELRRALALGGAAIPDLIADL